MVTALLLLLAAVMLRDMPGQNVARAGAALALGLCVQVVSSTPLFEARAPWPWQMPLIGISVGNAVLFWIFTLALFDDGFAWRPRHGLAWLAVVGLTVVNCIRGPEASGLGSWLHGVQRGVPLVFAALAAWAALAHWRADLVEPRRRLRSFILVTGVIYTLAQLVARLASPQGRLTGHVALADVAMLGGIAAVVVWQLLRAAESELFAAPATPAPVQSPLQPAPSKADSAPEHPPMPRCRRCRRTTAWLNHSPAGWPRNAPPHRRHWACRARRAAVGAGIPAAPRHQPAARPPQLNAYINGSGSPMRKPHSPPTRRETPVCAHRARSGFQSIGPFNRASRPPPGARPPNSGGKSWPFSEIGQPNLPLAGFGETAPPRGRHRSPSEAAVAFDKEPTMFSRQLFAVAMALVAGWPMPRWGWTSCPPPASTGR